MATVQATLLKLALMVDPNELTTGNKFTLSTIGVNDGEKFAKQRLLDIYNLARMTLTNGMRIAWPRGKMNDALAGQIVRDAAASFSAGGALTLPAGYISTVVLRTSTGVDIAVVPEWAYTHLARMESATNLFCFEEGNSLKAPPGSTLLNSVTGCLHLYIGVVDWVLADVTGGTASETVQEHWIPELLEVAAAIALEQGNTDPLALAVQLLNRENNAVKP